MKAILTRSLPATATRPARIKATDLDGNSITAPGYGRGVEDAHDHAALALCVKMNWPGDLIRGWIDTGAVYVFAHSDRVKNPLKKEAR